MKIEIIPCLKDNYSYLIIDKKNKKACVIDPSEAQPIINYLEKNKIQLTFILNTHHHYDHVGGNSELKKKYNAKQIKIIKSYQEDIKNNKIKKTHCLKELELQHHIQISIGTFNKILKGEY